MPRLRLLLALALSPFLIAIAACGGAEPLDGAALDAKFQDIVARRASLEFPCPQSELAVLPLGGFAYRVSGCDAWATYECDYDDTQGNNQDRNGANDNHWIYTCDRAAQDSPERVDAGTE